MTNFRAVIFDMDGVLVDTEPAWSRADARLIKAFGGSGDPDLERGKLMGMREYDTMKLYIERFGLLGTPDILLNARHRMLFEEVGQAIEPRKGVRELVALLDRAGRICSVASSACRDVVDHFIRSAGLSGMFDPIISGEEVAHGKPAPDIYRAVARRLRLEPSECVVVEDAQNGVEAAHAANMSCIGVLHAMNSREQLAAADATVEEVSDITLHLLQSL